MKTKAYFQHKGKVIAINGKNKLVMAITINPKNHKEAILRCVVSRTGDVTKTGSHDISKLYLLKGKSLTSFSIYKELKIKNSEKIIKSLHKPGHEFIGLEDPDIFYDEKSKIYHLYFTMPYIVSKPGKGYVYLGHALGRSLNLLRMTEPVLSGETQNGFWAKEVSTAPINKAGVMINLFESADRVKVSNGLSVGFSVVRSAIGSNMGKKWKVKDTILHPYKLSKKNTIYKWIAGDASPGPLLPKSFIDLGSNLMLGIMNGCEFGKFKNGKKIFGGHFTVGLFVYDYEKGKILWVSEKPIIKDSQAKRITFASQFIETKPGEGVLYAHVDDSFVRAYTLYADGIRKMLPKSFVEGKH
ncbi:MAG: hypothetical protein KGZ37_00415 [Nitrosarchaeum sp.]|nr:hypothetical protein [Nitrosarchaeum sp.]